MYVDLETIADVCFLYLNRPGANGLNLEFLDEILERIGWIENQDAIKVVILTSRQSFGFSSGLDLGSFLDPKQEVFAENVFQAVFKSYQIIRTVAFSAKIFIAALSGPVIGSAASLAFSCDFRIAALGTWFWLPDPQYGGFLADGGLELLTKLVGNSRADMLALTNDRVNLQQAMEWGLIYKVAEQQELQNMALATANRICGFSFPTLSLHKKVINTGLLCSFQGEQLKKVVHSEETYQRLRSYTKSRFTERE